jgi:hypothetical protein
MNGVAEIPKNQHKKEINYHDRINPFRAFP